MKIFRCQSCGQVVYFENTQCMNCGAVLGFLPGQFLMSSLDAAGDDSWRPMAPQTKGHRYKMCRNYTQEQVCNWMVPEHSSLEFCDACRFNQTIPDLTVTGNRVLWQRLEAGKRRLVYGLLRLGLPLISKQQDPDTGLAFAFLADPDTLFTENTQTMTVPARPKRDSEWFVRSTRNLIYKFENIEKKSARPILAEEEQHEVVERVQAAAEKATTPLRRW